jgi:ABC-type branched-subunit amino acid transport system ATPase component/ABC-type branched-subunit amino acid transport system permease subunit
LTDIAYLLMGLGAGAVYAALALALVVTFRSSGVVNLGVSTVALFGAYSYANLRGGLVFIPIPGLPPTLDLGRELGFWPAVVLAVLASASLNAVLYLVVFRPLRNAPPLSRVIASVAIMIALPTLIGLRLGTAPVVVHRIFPEGSTRIGETVVQHDRMYFAATIVLLTLAISAGYRYTRFGLATRAVAESEKGSILSGVVPHRIAFANWFISGAVAGLSGVLIAPIVPLVPVSYTLFIVPALAAAVLGRFTGLGLAVLGAFGLGMAQSELTHLTFELSWLPRSGVPELVPLVLIVGMLWRGSQALPERGALIVQQLAKSPRPRRILPTTIVAGGGGLACLILFSGVYRAGLITSFIFATICLSMVVITGYLGQISLAQLALAGVAGFSLSTLTSDWSVPFPIAPLLAASLATVVGVVVGLPALRLRGLTFAVLTLALAVAITGVWFRNPDLTDGSEPIEGPTLFGIDLRSQVGRDFDRWQFGVVALISLVAVAVVIALVRRGRFGGLMLAVRANERSAAATGIDVARVKVATFALSAFIAGIGGALLAYQRQSIGASSYEVLAGLSLFAFVYISGITSISGGILAGMLAPGGLAFVTLGRIFDVTGYYQLVAAVALIAATVFHPDGAVGLWHEQIERRRGARAARESVVHPALQRAGSDRGTIGAEPRPQSDGAPLLAVKGLTVCYGGLSALSALDLEVRANSIVGVIGPNGAGKTTMIDAICGFASSSGSVLFCGEDISSLQPHRRARAGLGRTFQAAELWDDLTVGENIQTSAVGPADDIVDLLELGALLDIPVDALSHGQRRVVSIARALATRPKLLLLDEPAAGLDSAESAALGATLRLVRERGTALLLVDHDMALVLSVCDEINVLDFGRLIASGSPDRVAHDEAVMAAYLGDAHGDMVEASGS